MTGDEDNLKTRGEQLYGLISRLFPICRSQTGNGIRQSLEILADLVSLQIYEVPTGTRVFDWEIPQEWNINDAYIANESGQRVVDFRESNLHVVNGSVPVKQRMAWSDLKNHLTTISNHPDWIPYRTVFFQEKWGFCLSQRQYDELERLGEREYDVCIDSTYHDGSLTFAECFLPGETEEEVLVSTHICHPSLANDGLSGIAIATHLAQWIQQQPRKYSYRFLFIPATIGAITWLSLNEDRTEKIRHGLVLSCLGDAGHLHYRRSRQGNAEIDRTVERTLAKSGRYHSLLEFEPFGYDQRQFCSPGFDLPMGCLMRTPNEKYPEYHTSADDLNLVRPEALEDSLDTLIGICQQLEEQWSPRYLNTAPKCEPRLGKSGLYHAFGTRPNAQALQRAMLWGLNLSDGRHSLRDIADQSRVPLNLIEQAAELLEQHGFLAPVNSTQFNIQESGYSRLAETAV